MGKTKSKKTLGRPRQRQEENIKMAIKEMGSRVRTGLIWLRIRTGGRLL
jgi:hypothetical protein